MKEVVDHFSQGNFSILMVIFEFISLIPKELVVHPNKAAIDFPLKPVFLY